MKLLDDIAKSIVSEISRTVNQNVNLMDNTGLIISSTNAERIGTYHEGAQKIIREKLEFLIIKTDEDYSGSKMGINMPIYFKGDIIGVLGISGEWRQIERYLQLIQKTTEAYLMNSYLQKKDDILRTEQYKYIHDLLSEDSKLPEDYMDSGLLIDIDLTIPRRCLCFSFIENLAGSQKINNYMLEQLDQVINRMKNNSNKLIIYRTPTKLYTFLSADQDIKVLDFIKQVRNRYNLTDAVSLKVGIDDRAYSGPDLKIGKKKAEKSLRSALNDKDHDTVFYNTLTVGVFISEIPENSKREYINKVFLNMDTDELPYWIKLLEIYYLCEGSINKTADLLFIHKNTLQYQLKKLAALTGYDPRSLKNSALYQTAIWFWNTL